MKDFSFIDETKIKLIAGDGGNGIVSFRRERFIPRGGPDGGDGGKGGDIWLITDSQETTLTAFRRQRVFRAENGRHGKGGKKTGASGQDLILKVPVGTLVWEINELAGRQTKKLIADLKNNNQKILIVKGGRGGWGNRHFATSTFQAPRMANKGGTGQQKEVFLELKILADIGIIGLPNVGKSSLLAKISNARPKIADYPFTTLKPNLGFVELPCGQFLFCDVPGLIEGAWQGRGLGDRFLKHIERTKILIHLLDGTSLDLKKSYQVIRQELASWNKKLLKKPEIVVINKIDLDANWAKKHNEFIRAKKPIAISALTGTGLKTLFNKICYFLK